MAVADAMTLLDMSNIEKDPLRKAVLLTFYENLLPSPAERIPFKEVESLGVTVSMLSTVDTPTMRHVNTGGTAWKATWEQFAETLKVLENYFTIDPVILMNKNLITDPREAQISAYTRQVNYLINDLLINGDSTTDAKNPDGIKTRLVNDAKFAGQTVDAYQSGPVGLNVDASDANRLLWLDFIDLTRTKIDGGNPTFYAVNSQTWIKFRSTLRALKLLDTTKDQFEREISSYYGTPFLDCGVPPAYSIVGPSSGVAASQIIQDDTETSPNSAANTTPMYLVKVGEDHFCGLQLGGGVDVKRFGESVANPEQDKTRFRWVFGWFAGHPRCIARLTGLDIT